MERVYGEIGICGVWGRVLNGFDISHYDDDSCTDRGRLGKVGLFAEKSMSIRERDALGVAFIGTFVLRSGGSGLVSWTRVDRFFCRIECI